MARPLLRRVVVKAVLPRDGSRISPVLDAARTFVLVAASSGGALTLKEVLIAETDPVTHRPARCGRPHLRSDLVAAGSRAHLGGHAGDPKHLRSAQRGGSRLLRGWLDRAGLPVAGLPRSAAQTPPSSRKGMAEQMVISEKKRKEAHTCQEETEQVQPDWAR